MISIICNCCGKPVEIPISLEQYITWKRSGEFVQRAFPNLSAGHREMLISQTCDNCFKEIFPENEEDYED